MILAVLHEVDKTARLRRNQLRRNLNWCLLILKTLILVASVDCGIPSLAAAPDGPETRPLVSTSAASIISRSVRGATLRIGPDSARDACGEIGLESHSSSTEKTSVVLRITDLSTMFCSSRMLPGQSYDCSKSRVFLSIDPMFLCPRLA